MSDKPGHFDTQQLIKTLPRRPGVYQMLDEQGKTLYVGKAKNIKNRVSSYFRAGLDTKTLTLISKTAQVEVTVTTSEAEALILENNLIKSKKPKYNILLRDDKSYPYIYLSNDTFPRFAFYRGSKKQKGRYFGPYASAGAVRETLQLLQKLFPVRQCENSFFRNRSRPCLQYQLKRCTAPCVRLVEPSDYMQDVQDAELFLEGKSEQLTDHLMQRMDDAAAGLEYERAARYRDQITALRKIQQRQYAATEGGDCDVVAAVWASGRACVQVFRIRNGVNLGSRNYFPDPATEQSASDVMCAFLPLMYLNKTTPPEIIVNESFEDLPLLEKVLSEQNQKTVKIRTQVRGERAQWLRLATSNAAQALERQAASRAGLLTRFEALQKALGLDVMPERLECFDVSHTMGEETVASCVAFDINGAVKSDYRRYKIKGVKAGDDYQAMRQALERRFKKTDDADGVLPDVLFIDGGKGQLAQAEDVFQELAIKGVQLVGIAKGPERKAGKEVLFLSGSRARFILPADSHALHLIQAVRDEAHRFAITGHRTRRDKARRRSTLEDIPGIGQKRRRSLLHYFGGLQGLTRASQDDIEKVPGISKQLAEKIYESLHG